MTDRLTISFAPLEGALMSTAVLLAEADMTLGDQAAAIDKKSEGALERAAEAANFTGTAKSSIEVLAPAGLSKSGIKTTRLILAGVGEPGELTRTDWRNIGGQIYAAVSQRKTKTASLIAQTACDCEIDEAQRAALIGQGALLRSYEFDRYKTKARKQSEKTKSKDSGKNAKLAKLVILTSNPKAAEKAFKSLRAVADGIFTARDLVNEPANTLGPKEFAEHASELSKLGVEVEILDEKALKKLKMGALLSVSQGSSRSAYVAVMKWNGAKSKKAKPLCFVGKGVVFDTGGISMKPAGGMEDMKGDMGGAACVLGLMQALAGRKAPVNAVGLIGLVENMPSGNATRPGDIVTSMSGQTIEVLNTDAEGRLVLADVLHYTQENFEPELIIDLATLTGAIMVALGKEYAGLFSNDDELADNLYAAGVASGERVWRMPLDPAYDKLINGKFGDVKNIGGRYAGAITAAQFLKRFIHVDGLAWAHLDIAGTAMGSVSSDINRSWGSGWGVDLLNRMIEDAYEG